MMTTSLPPGGLARANLRVAFWIGRAMLFAGLLGFVAGWLVGGASHG